MAASKRGPRVEMGPSLAFSLRFDDGATLATASDQSLSDALVVHQLELEVTEPEFPSDLERGAQEIRSASTRLRRLELDIALDALAELLGQALRRIGAPIRDLRLIPADDRLILKADLKGPDAQAAALYAVEVQVAPAKDSPHALLLALGDAYLFGSARVPPKLFLSYLFESLERHLMGLSELLHQGLKRAAPGGLRLDPVHLLVEGLMPPAGWQLADTEGLRFLELKWLPKGLVRLVYDGDPAKSPSPKLEALSQKAAAWLQREEAPIYEELAFTDRPADAFDLSESGASQAFERWLGQEADSFAEDQAMLLAIAYPALQDACAVLLARRLKAKSKDPQALLLRAAVETEAGQRDRAAKTLEEAGRQLRFEKKRPIAGLAFRAASALPGADRARLLEESITLLPDDPVVLQGLIDVLPKVGRAAGAIRAARRLSSISPDLETRVLAHVAAADLLRDEESDLVGAKRELARALKLSEGHVLARISMAAIEAKEGKLEAAAARLEALIADVKDPADLALLRVKEADLWLEKDPERALRGYQAAHEAAPDALEPLLAVIRQAEVLHDGEALFEAVNAALPLAKAQDPVDAAEVARLELALARALSGQEGREAEAIAHFEAALSEIERSPEQIQELAQLAARLPDPADRAHRLVTLGQELSEHGAVTDAAAAWKVASEALSAGDPLFSVLLEQLGLALTRAPGDRALLDLQVHAAEAAGDTSRLIEALDRRLVLDDPKALRAQLFSQQGAALLRVSREADAARAYEQAVAEDPTHLEAIEALLKLYERRGDHRRLARALGYASRQAGPGALRQAELYRQADLLLGLGDLTAAEEAAQAALDEGIEEEATRKLMARIQSALNHPEAAVAQLEAALQLELQDAPSRLETLRLLADTLEAQNQAPERQVEVLRAAVQLSPLGSDQAERLTERLARQLEQQSRLRELADLNRERAEQAEAPTHDRASWLFRAAEIGQAEGELAQATQDAEAALALVLELQEGGGLRRQLFLLLEGLYRQASDPEALANFLDRRAQSAVSETAKEADLLEALRLRANHQSSEIVLASAEAARAAAPNSARILEELAGLASLAGAHDRAAQAYEDSAKLSETRSETRRAIAFYARASEAYQALGEVERAKAADRDVLRLSRPELWGDAAEAAALRLEAIAKAEGDAQSLSQLMEKRAEAAHGDAAVEYWLQKAELDERSLSDPESARSALRRARRLVLPNSPLAGPLHTAYTALLGKLGEHQEEAKALVERAEQVQDPSERASLWVEAARCYEDRLGDRRRALSALQAALRADPDKEEARALRLALLRHGDSPESLAETLSEEAARQSDPEQAAALWLEAAEVVLPSERLDAPEGPTAERLRRALSLVRRAASQTPNQPKPLRLAVRYTWALHRPEEELAVLEALAKLDIDPIERLSCQLRRGELLEATGDRIKAQSELAALLEPVSACSEAEAAALREALLAKASKLLERPEPQSLKASLLEVLVRLAEANEDWRQEVFFLEASVEASDDPRRIAELRIQAAEVLDSRLQDTAAAEASLRQAYALEAKRTEAGEALSRLYLRDARFDTLAEVLGTPVLQRAWADMEGDSLERRLGAATALWPRLSLEEGQAAIKLTAAQLKEELPESDDAGATRLYEEVRSEGSFEEQGVALSRLQPLYLKAGRIEDYTGVLASVADRIEAPEPKAEAITDLAEALEDRQDDVNEAERAYRRALSVDANQTRAQRRLADLLAKQDRFHEIAKDVGSDWLRQIIDRLLGGGPSNETRAFGAVQVLVGSSAESERAALWLSVADTALQRAESRGPAWELAMLRRGAQSRGGAQLQALDRLADRLREKHANAELVDVLRQRSDLTEDASTSVQIRYELADRLIDLGAGLPNREATDREAETLLRALIAEDSENDEARARLGQLLESESRWKELGETVGTARLVALRGEADDRSDADTAKALLRAHADLSEGEAKAAILVDMVRYFESEDPEGVLALYREALAADSGYEVARTGLRKALEAEARYRELAVDLGVELLRDTVNQLKAAEDHPGLLPASLALADALEGDPAFDEERRGLVVEAARLHDAEGDDEAAEWSLRQVLEEDLSHAAARAEVTRLFVEQDRLSDLADLDPSLLLDRVEAAKAESEDALAIAGLSVLAERDHAGQAAAFWQEAAELSDASGDVEAAEAAYRNALEADPDLDAAKAGLTELFWTQARYVELSELLEPARFLEELRARESEGPAEVVAAVSAVTLPQAEQAEALELAASLTQPRANAESEAERKEAALLEAKALWDALEDREAGGRVRLALVRLTQTEAPTEPWVARLADAFAYTDAPEGRATLGEELVACYVALDDDAAGREQAALLLEEPDLPPEPLVSVSEAFVDRLADPEDHELRQKALLILIAHGSEASDKQAAWQTAMADTLEALGYESEEVIEALEAAVAVSEDAPQQLALHRRLYRLYDELGDWQSAEVHATPIALADEQPEKWVTVSELRAWLDDREGAKEALSRALLQDPSYAPAHESMIRLAESYGESEDAIAQYRVWVAADEAAEPRLRAQRLIQAARLAEQADDAELAGQLFEEAAALMPADDPERFAIAQEVDEGLEALQLSEPRARVLTALLTEAKAHEERELRLRLADLWTELDQPEAAIQALDAGLHREIALEDPLLARVLESAQSMPAEAAAQRLLAASEQLRSGPAARLLGLEGAGYAEAAGLIKEARAALSRLVAEAGADAVGDKAREALLRLTGEDEDAEAHLAARIASAEHLSDPKARAQGFVQASELAKGRLQDPARAEALLRRALDLQPTDPALRETLIQHLEGEKAWLPLEALFKDFTPTEGPERATWLWRQAELREKQLGDLAGAARLQRRAFEASQEASQGLLALRALVQAGLNPEAESLVFELEQVSKPPEAVWRDTQRVWVEVLEAEGRVHEAERRLAEAARACPDSRLLKDERLMFLLRHKMQAALSETLKTVGLPYPPEQALALRLAAQTPPGELSHLKSAWEQVKAVGLTSPVIGLKGGLFGQLQEHGRLASPSLELALRAQEAGDFDLAFDVLDTVMGSLPEGHERWRVELLLAALKVEAGAYSEAADRLQKLRNSYRELSCQHVSDRVQLERVSADCLAQGDPGARAEALGGAFSRLFGQDATRAIGLKLSEIDALKEAGRPKAGLKSLCDLAMIDVTRVSLPLWDEAVRDAGPSRLSAQLSERVAEQSATPKTKVHAYVEAAQVYRGLGEVEESLRCLALAYEHGLQSPAVALQISEGFAESRQLRQRAAHLARRIEREPLSEETKRQLQLERAGLLAWQLMRPEEALAIFDELSETAPFVSTLRLAVATAGLAKDWVRAERGLKALSERVKTPTELAKTLTQLARLQTRRGDTEAAIASLEAAIQADGKQRAAVEALAAIYREADDLASEAALWLRFAQAAQGAASVASLARGAEIRWGLEDRRGALAAYEAAVRMGGDQLSLHWALIELSQSMGDLDRLRHWTERALEIAKTRGLSEAIQALLWQAQSAAMEAGDLEAETAVWLRLLKTPLNRAELEDLVARLAAGLSKDAILEGLSAAISAQNPGLERAKLRWTEALIAEHLDGDLERAEAIREAVLAEDGEGYEALALRPVMDEAAYQRERGELEDEGQIEALAMLDFRYAQTLATASQRAFFLVKATDRLLAKRRSPAADRQALAFLIAASTHCPGLIGPWRRRLPIAIRLGLWQDAAETSLILESMGGGAFSPAEFQILAAQAYEGLGDTEAAAHWLARAKAEDPDNPRVLERMAKLAPRLEDRKTRQAWLNAYGDALDPLTEAEAWIAVELSRAKEAAEAGEKRLQEAILDGILDVHPECLSARQEKLKCASLEPESVFYLDALEQAAIFGMPELREEALILAGALQLPARQAHLIADMAENASGDTLKLVTRTMAKLGDASGLLALYDAGRWVEPQSLLTVEVDVLLTYAFLVAGRPAEAFVRVAAQPDAGDRDRLLFGDDPAPEARVRRQRAWQEGADALSDCKDPEICANPEVARGLELALHRFGPVPQLLSARLAMSPRPIDQTVLFKGLAERPLDLALLTALVESTDSMGVKAALALMDDAVETVPFPALSKVDEASLAWLLPSRLHEPGAQVLRITAMAAASLGKRPMLAEQLEDPRLEALESWLGEVWPGLVLRIRMQGDGGLTATLQPGSPTTLYLGEALVRSASPEELRFHVLREGVWMLLGGMILQIKPLSELERSLSLLFATTDPDAEPSHKDAEAHLRLMGHLSQADQQLLHALGPELKHQAFCLDAWADALGMAADRIAAMACGDLAAAILGMKRRDPRRWQAPASSPEEERRNLVGWRRVRRLLGFLIDPENPAFQGGLK